MRAILVFGLILAFFSLPVPAAKDSQAFALTVPSDARIGDIQLRKGRRIHVTWTRTSGSLVQLTITTPDKKTITVTALMKDEKHKGAGTETYVVNSVEYLKALQTEKASFIIQDLPGAINRVVFEAFRYFLSAVGLG